MGIDQPGPETPTAHPDGTSPKAQITTMAPLTCPGPLSPTPKAPRPPFPSLHFPPFPFFFLALTQNPTHRYVTVAINGYWCISVGR